MFPSYPSQAKTKDECIQAMTGKIKEFKNEIKFFEIGLEQIKNLEEKKFYEVIHTGITFFAQCWKFGRDHVEFRILSCNISYDQAKAKTSRILGDQKSMSLYWNNDFATTPVDAMIYGTLCINHEWKTDYYEKLLKGKYLCPKSSDDSQEFTPIPSVQSAV